MATSLCDIEENEKQTLEVSQTRYISSIDAYEQSREDNQKLPKTAIAKAEESKGDGCETATGNYGLKWKTKRGKEKRARDE